MSWSARIFLGLMLLVLWLNGVLFTAWIVRERYWFAALVFTVSLVTAGAIFLNAQTMYLKGRIAGLNTAAGCDNAPATVPYHPGMTLCPGQSTVIELEIPTGPPGERGL